MDKCRSAKLAKFSLDLQLLAIQVSDITVLVVDLSSGKEWKVELVQFLTMRIES